MREDQAAGLRRLFAQRTARVLLVAEPAWPRRGWLALNLAAAYSRAGEQVLVLDAERESLGSLWGARCRYELGHVMDGDRRLIDVIVPGPEASAILPMRRGGATLARQGRAGQRQLASVLNTFMEHDGLLVVPVSPSTLESQWWRFGGGDLLFCIGDGAAATTGAYASIKTLLTHRPQLHMQVALAGADTARIRFDHLGAVVRRFIGAKLAFAGELPVAELAGGSAGRTLFDESPGAARPIEALAHAAAAWRLPQLEMAARPEARRSTAVATI